MKQAETRPNTDLNDEPRWLETQFKRWTGFKWARIAQWRLVLWAESRTLGWPRIAIALLGGVWVLGGVSKGLWRERMRACARCPVYDRKLKRCRPWAESSLGCGCYMPLKALTGDPDAACWARGRLDGLGMAR